MEIKEAIEILEDNRIFTKACEYSEEEQWEALDKAMKSLEAWDQVIKDLQEYYDAAAAANEIISGTQQYTIENCIEIVKRNLGGLKNEDQEKESFYF